MASQYPKIILFGYPESIFTRRLASYLLLRHIPYASCLQPPQIPRPDLTASLGIHYRRIPLLAINRDVYCDTRLIISKLESLFPHGKLGSEVDFERGLEGVFESFTIDAGPFWRTAGCLPLDAPLLNDEVWLRDRFEITGGRFTREGLERGRGECLAHLRVWFGMVERLLGDGRRWVLGGEGVGLGDVHLGWSFGWALHIGMGGGVENIGVEVLNEREFPRVVEWVERFRGEVKRAEEVVKPGRIESRDAIQHILGSEVFEEEGEVDPVDPLKLKKGQQVKVGPGDHGSAHQDQGELLSLTTNEVVIASNVPDGNGVLRLHYPRINISIQPV